MSTIDNPTQSLFQGTEIQINTSQNNEEDEDLEDQLRRKEELQNLLHEALDDFNYDDSTINSSTNVSVASLTDVHRSYRDALPSDQLKVLYDVKCREIVSVKQEFDRFKVDKKKETDNIKNKLILCEADIMQLKESVKNSEGLLLEKTENIKLYQKTLNSKDEELNKLKSIIEEYKIEVSTYKATINELQIKMAESNPFKMGAKQFETEELHKAQIDQILKLESIIEENAKKAVVYEKENNTLKNDLNKLIQIKNEMENEYKIQVDMLTFNLNSAQQQCKDLVDIVEMLKNENEHFKERVHSYQNNDPILSEESLKRKSLEYDTLLVQLEKVKRILLDKSVELSTYKTKLKSYENNLKELLEFRAIKTEICTKQYRKCDVIEHVQDLLVMQNEIKNLTRTIDDREKQINNVTIVNHELQGKIEDMLLKTRTEIQNLSNKYNVPQLEIMSEELNKAQSKVLQLEFEIKKLEEQNNKLTKGRQDSNVDKISHFESEKNKLKEEVKKYKNEIKEYESNIQDLKSNNKSLKTELKMTKDSIQEQLNQFMTHLKQTAHGSEIENPKVILLIKTELDELIHSIKDLNVEKNVMEEKLCGIKKQLDFIKFSTKSRDSLNTSSKEGKELYEITLRKLEEAKIKIANLEETIEEIGQSKTITEGEKCNLQYHLKDCETRIEHLMLDNGKLTEALSAMLKKSENGSDTNVEALRKDLKYKEELVEKYVKDKNELGNLFDILDGELTKTKEEVRHLEEELKIEKGKKKESLSAKDIVTIENLKLELKQKDEQIILYNKEKEKIGEVLEAFKNELSNSKKEILRLEKELCEAREKHIRRDLRKELEEAESQLEKTRIEEDCIIMETVQFKKCLQTEIIKKELILHEEYQKEFSKKLNEIEKRYMDTINVYKKELEKAKGQESVVRSQIGQLMNECGQKMIEMEVERNNYLEELKSLQKEYADLKDRTTKRETEYRMVVEGSINSAKKNEEHWKKLTSQFVRKLTIIGQANKAAGDQIMTKLNTGEKQISKIERKTEQRKAKVKLNFVQ
ncbi:unnamed protein product [Brassicogethes aeneus]|uniref:Uncharacterized protein n=1 Tax=Brassicogethes aeneus TaxID=1431903 RepID=A0A9P0FGF5_BRAAE|nr:unnamed protein product [Brassicogethes aeneus]